MGYKRLGKGSRKDDSGWPKSCVRNQLSELNTKPDLDPFVKTGQAQSPKDSRRNWGFGLSNILEDVIGYLPKGFYPTR
jgi:hypothetical protein